MAPLSSFNAIRPPTKADKQAAAMRHFLLTEYGSFLFDPETHELLKGDKEEFGDFDQLCRQLKFMMLHVAPANFIRRPGILKDDENVRNGYGWMVDGINISGSHRWITARMFMKEYFSDPVVEVLRTEKFKQILKTIMDLASNPEVDMDLLILHAECIEKWGDKFWENGDWPRNYNPPDQPQVSAILL